MSTTSSSCSSSCISWPSTLSQPCFLQEGGTNDRQYWKCVRSGPSLLQAAKPSSAAMESSTNNPSHPSITSLSTISTCNCCQCSSLSSEIIVGSPPPFLEIRQTPAMGYGVFAKYCLHMTEEDEKLAADAEKEEEEHGVPITASGEKKQRPTLKVLGIYSGKIQPVNVHAIRRREDSEYTVQVSEDALVNSELPPSTPASAGSSAACPLGLPRHWSGMINHSHRRANVRIGLLTGGRVELLHSIHAGCQLLLDYGSDYWLWQCFQLKSSELSVKERFLWEYIYARIEDFSWILQRKEWETERRGRIEKVYNELLEKRKKRKQEKQNNNNHSSDDSGPEEIEEQQEEEEEEVEEEELKEADDRDDDSQWRRAKEEREKNGQRLSRSLDVAAVNSLHTKRISDDEWARVDENTPSTLAQALAASGEKRGMVIALGDMHR